MEDAPQIVIYRWKVASAQEAAFRESWRGITQKLRSLGGLGSCLTRDDQGLFVALAAWPAEAVRAAAFAQLAAQPPLPGVERVAAEVLEVTDDLWGRSPFQLAD